MEKYEAYKDSGVQWLGEIPSHWKCIRLRRLANLKTGTTPSFFEVESRGETINWYTPADFKEEFILSGAERKLDKRSFDESGYSYIPKDSVMLIGIGGTAGKSSLTTVPCYSNQQITSIIPKHGVVPLFLLMYFRTIRPHLLKTAHYTTLPILNNAFLSSIQCLLPPLTEQQAIVSYLDDKCAKLDQLVANKEKELELLAEMKQRVIADAVTRGLNPDVKFKETGISWLPQIPEHWNLESLRKFLHLTSVKNHADKQLLSVTREQGVIVRNTESKEENHNFIPEDLSNYKYVEVGDFCINKMKSWQGSYGVSEYEGIVSPAYFVCKLSGVDKKFFSMAIRSRAYVPFFAQYSKGIRVDQWDLSPIGLKSIPFFLPPLAEQQAIVAHIEEKVSKIDTLAQKLQQEIDSIKEYKQRLISDVVTGQIKVC